jgi:hypothetical protein
MALSSSSVSRGVAIDFLKESLRGGAKRRDVLGPDLFKGKVSMPKISEFPSAIDYAVQQGWIEKLEPDQYRLTDAGYAMALTASAFQISN